MTANTSIEWTDKTWNPIVGCSVVSPGCTNCYAMRMAARIEAMQARSSYGGTTQPSKAGPVWTGKVAMASDETLTAPLHWRKPVRIFVNSMGDLFHESVPDEWIDGVFAVMALSPQHTFQVLTKRSKRMRQWFEEKWQGTPAQTVMGLHIPAGGPTGRRGQIESACEPLLEAFGLVDTENDALWTEDGECKATQWPWPLPNVHLGVSAEDQTRADERIPDLLATPAAIRFVSAEPLLGPIDFMKIDVATWLDTLRAPEKRRPRDEFDPDMCWPLLTPFEHWPSGYSSPGLDWIIVGGESGPGTRPMHPDWPRLIRDQCAAAHVPFFMKQMTKKAAIPADLMIREFPIGMPA